MPDPVKAYPIFDVSRTNSNVITFLRYQSEPQGDRIYRDRSNNLVHEICGSATNNLRFNVGSNYYDDFKNKTVYHDRVANINDPFTPGAYNTSDALAPQYSFENPQLYNIRNDLFFTIRLMGPPMGRNKVNRLYNEGVTVSKGMNWKGDYFVYQKRSISEPWNARGAENYINYVGSRDRNKSDPYKKGMSLIDVIVRKIYGEGGYPDRYCYSFNNPFFPNNNNMRLSPEWSPLIERWKLVEMVTPFVDI